MSDRFVILTFARHGSNMLVSMLNAHPDIVCHQELFNPRHVGLSLKDQDKWRAAVGNSTARRDANGKAFLEQILAASLQDYRLAGFKLLPTQNLRLFLRILRRRDFRKIVLVRRNLLRSYVSLRKAELSSTWVVPERMVKRPDEGRADGTSPEGIRVRLTALAYYLFKIGALRLIIRSARLLDPKRYIYLQYESILEPGSLVDTLCFLGVDDSIELSPGTRKQSTGSLRHTIANYGSVRLFMSLLGLRYMLSDST